MALPCHRAKEATTGETLALPAPDESRDVTRLNVNGGAVLFNHLGPVVVNEDGSLSRIANWDKMMPREQEVGYADKSSRPLVSSCN